jgi:hypothetical protein
MPARIRRPAVGPAGLLPIVRWACWMMLMPLLGLWLASAAVGKDMTTTVPIVLDHNRVLVDAEMRRADGTWRSVRLWVDTGAPDFIMSPALARDLGIDLSTAEAGGPTERSAPLDVPPPLGARLGGVPLGFEGISCKVLFSPPWLFSTTHADANLPSTVLRNYRVVFDYPHSSLTLAAPGSLRPRGVRAPAHVDPRTGIVQIDALVDGDSLSFALDNGASYSFVSQDLADRLIERHPDWPHRAGALGCANIWGWWPQEERWPVLRVPEIRWGPVRLTGVGVVGLPAFFGGGATLGSWYSQKTARPVSGFLGPNAFRAYRVEIDYAAGAVYFEQGAPPDLHDMDLVGLTLRPEPDGSYRVIGVASSDGRSLVEGVETGDTLLRVGNLAATGATMGTVIDALRGRPGERRVLTLGRNGGEITVEATVISCL